jgi:aldehyde:ferredoxin oxidoreductase
MNRLPTSSNCGGDFGLHLKRAGYDALILAGRCKSHRWLEIRDGEFLFHEADTLWGTQSDVCQQMLDEGMQNSKYGKLYIGPAGENCVRFASVLDGTHTSGRSGIGAVFGWKNLKAITVTGTNPLPVYDSNRTAELKKECFTRLHNHPLTGKNSRSGGRHIRIPFTADTLGKHPIVHFRLGCGTPAAGTVDMTDSFKIIIKPCTCRTLCQMFPNRFFCFFTGGTVCAHANQIAYHITGQSHIGFPPSISFSPGNK